MISVVAVIDLVNSRTPPITMTEKSKKILTLHTLRTLPSTLDRFLSSPLHVFEKRPGVALERSHIAAVANR